MSTPIYDNLAITDLDNLHGLEDSVMSGLFPYVRLCDERAQPIVSAKRTKTIEKRRTHWSFIRRKLEHELPPGNYYVECCYDSSRKNLHVYRFRKPENYKPEKVTPPTPTTTINPPSEKIPSKMTEDKIYAMIKENAELNANNNFLTQQNELLSKRIIQLEEELEAASLEDPEPQPDAWTRLADVFEKIVPKAMPMIDRHFDMKEREMLMKYGQNQQPQHQQVARKIPVQNQTQQVDVYQQQLAAIDRLFAEGKENEANEILAQVYENDQALYNRICHDLNLTDANE